MIKLKTNVGDVYDKLTVRKRVANGAGGQTRFLLDCVCGGTIIKFAQKLRGKPDRQDCGCNSSAGQIHIKHGMSSDTLFSTFRDMHNRCKYDPYYVNISVCKEWAFGMAGFLAWKKHMGPRPGGYSNEREDNDGDYEPSNSSWQNSKTQSINKSNNRYYKSLSTGVIMVRAHWAKKLGIKCRTFRQQLKADKHPDLVEVSYQAALEYRQSSPD